MGQAEQAERQPHRAVAAGGPAAGQAPHGLPPGMTDPELHWVGCSGAAPHSGRPTHAPDRAACLPLTRKLHHQLSLLSSQHIQADGWNCPFNGMVDCSPCQVVQIRTCGMPDGLVCCLIWCACCTSKWQYASTSLMYTNVFVSQEWHLALC